MPRLLVIFLLSTAVQLSMGQSDHDLNLVTDPQKEGLVDSTVTLKCDYEPSPTNPNSYIVEWKFESEATDEEVLIFKKDGAHAGTPYGDFVGRTAIVGNKADLQISRLKLSDTGDYVCKVDFYMDDIDDSGETRLEVYKPVDEADIVGHERGAYISAPVGEELTLTCRVGKGRPQSEVKWYKDDTKLDSPDETYTDNRDGTYNSTSTLVYTPVAMDYGAIIKCQSDQTPEISDIYRSDTVVLNTGGSGSTVTASVFLLLACIIMSVWS
ncbi:CD276 antigen-like isoform X1 [Ptychodera flava]|uniref:CD276 antigen-like isoform X1 n=1 Tax=Ptychodera flava TaxID=63121 RepID=UPI00396AAA73